MDEKTEELRDIFLSVAGDEEVTEKQEQGRGSLVRDTDVRAELQERIAEMRDALGFETTRSLDELVTIVERFYDGDTDTEIARALGDQFDGPSVARARFDLHLIRDADLEEPVSIDRVRTLVDEGVSATEMAEELDVSTETIARYRRILEAQNERRRVADRYRASFEEILQDRDIAERLTSSLEETGLDGATADQEVDVDF